MSELLVFTYEQADKAAEVLTKVAAMKQENVHKALIGIEDAAVAVADAQGKVKIRQTLETAVKGSSIVSGGLWGTLVGFLFGGPLLGALFGAGISALLGRKIDVGIDNDFIQKISDELKPGTSALFLLIDDTPVETIASVLTEFGGKLNHTSLSEEAAEAFAQAGEHEQVKQALEGEVFESDNKNNGEMKA